MTDLQAEIEELRQENVRLRKLLKLTDAEAAPARGTQTAWFDKAVAHGRAFGPDAGLAVLERIGDGELADSPLVPSVRGDLLERAGRYGLARQAFTEAAARTKNESERALLHRRAQLNRTRVPK